MKDEKRQARMAQIEAAAYGLMAEQGFEGTSMLAVAKAAKASNETMYRWYGDKHGLFESMVRANADKVREELNRFHAAERAPLDILRRVAPVLLDMLLGERAIALNRAAASDPSGRLGRAISAGGRETVLPLLQKLMGAAINDGSLRPPKEGDIAALFMSLLVGDRQVRRVIGVMAPPSPREIEAQAQIAMAQFTALCGVSAARAP